MNHYLFRLYSILFLLVIFGLNSSCYQLTNNSNKGCSYSSPLQKNTLKKELFLFNIREGKQLKYGYISKVGKIIIKSDFYEGSPFKDGYAIVRTRPPRYIKDNFGGYALININGEIVVRGTENELFLGFEKEILTKLLSIPDEIEHYNLFTKQNNKGEYKLFRDGLSSAISSGNNKYGFMDRSGIFKIKPVFTDVTEFFGGLASVTTESSRNGNYRIINTKGNLGPYLDDKLSIDNRFTADILPELVRFNLDGIYGYVDRCANVVIPPTYYYASSFNEGVAIVGNKKMYEIIDRNGKTLIKLDPKIDPLDTSLGKYHKHTRLFHFSNGLARAKINNKYGYINKEGKFMIPANFIDANDFVNGLASVRISANSWAYVDIKGKLIWREPAN